MTNVLTEMRAVLPAQGHKRDHDDFLATSSDPPMFSSDPPVFATSVDDYQQPCQKRQHKGAWYELDKAEELRMKKNRRHPGLRRAARQRRPFRKFDSGVYMGSDESTESELSKQVSRHRAPQNATNCAEMDGAWDSDVEDLDLDEEKRSTSRASGDLNEDELFEKATQTVDDPGNFEGPVFPYWQDQPESLKSFHLNQRVAQDKVLRCVDRGEEVVDLSNSYLRQIRAPTLRPLRFHVRQEFHSSRRRPAKYKHFTPALNLLLSNNDLTIVPGELYHLTNLVVLSLRGNNIKELLPAISRLTSLKELNLASNQLPYLPYELLSLLQDSLNNITLYPNPFIRLSHLSPPGLAVDTSTSSELEQDSPESSGKYSHIASTHTAFLDISGNFIREYPPPPSQFPTHAPKPSENPAYAASPVTESQQRTPSLLELCLRSAADTPELSHLPFHFPSTDCPHLRSLLQRTFYLKESGGQNCTVCDKNFIIPRTEWVEWWSKDGAEPVPFLRRGCSWACFPDTDEENVQRVGWEGGAGNEGEGGVGR